MAENAEHGNEVNLDESLNQFGERFANKLLSSSQLKVTPFANAPGQDLEEWLQQYEFAAVGAGWDAAKMGERIGSHMIGAARAWYQDRIRDAEENFSYEDVVGMMRNDFLSSGYKQHLRERVRRRKQGLFEGVANFIFIMKGLIKRMDRNLDESEVVERIIEGMLPQIAAKVIPLRPRCVEDLLEKAKLVEKALRCEAKMSDTGNYTDFAEVVPEVVDKKVLVDERVPDIAKIVDQMTKTFSEAMAKMSAGNRQSWDRPKNESKRSPNRNRSDTRTSTGKPKCFNCGKVGHIAKSCYSEPKSTGTNEKSATKTTKPEVSHNVLHKKTSDERNDLIYVSVTVKGLTTRAMVDSGASISFIREDFRDELGLPIQKYLGGGITGINGTKVVPSGVVHLPVELMDSNGTNAYFHVAAVLPGNCPSQVVIGNNVTTKLDGVLNLGKLSFELPKGPPVIVDCKTCASKDRQVVHLKEDVCIPPRVTKCVPAVLSSRKDDFMCIVNSYDEIYNTRRVIMPNTVVSAEKGITRIPVSNFANEKKELKKGTAIGVYEVITDAHEITPISSFTPDVEVVESANASITSSRDKVDDLKASPEKESESDCPCHQDNSEEYAGDIPTDECIPMRLGEGHVNVSITLNEKNKEELWKVLQRFKGRFAFDPLKIGKTDMIVHEIRTGNAKPVRRGPYKCSILEREIIKRQVDEFIKMGILSKSKSPWGAGVVLVRKPDESYRFCCDWRPLNSVTEFDSYPMLDVNTAMSAMRGVTRISSFDLNKAYHQVEIRPEDRPKTTVVTMDGSYQWNRMGMGMLNAAATLQRLSDIALSGLHFNMVICYSDDGRIFSFGDFNDHLEKIITVFGRLEKANLTMKPEKCSFGMTRTKYLGHVIDAVGISPDPEKIRQIKERPQPKSVPDIRSFLGLAGYYRSFVPNFSIIAKPLSDMTRKGKRFEWGNEQERAYDELRNSLSRRPVLAHFNPQLSTELRCDASDSAIAAILVQKHRPGWRMVGCTARNLSDTERKYPIGEREMLAIVFGLQKFRCYLFGIEFVVVTDHANHANMMTRLNPSDRVARWLLHCMDFKFKVVYRPGNRNRDADDLSRNASDKPVHFEPTDMLAMYADVKSTSYAAVDENANPVDELLKWTESYPPLDVKRDQRKDKFCANIFNYLENLHVLSNKTKKRLSRFAILRGVLYREVKNRMGNKFNLVVPKSMLKDLMYTLHDDPLSGHASFRKTFDRVKVRYWWPQMYKFVEKYCKSCLDCQMKGSRTQLTPGLLKPIPVRGPWRRVGVDAVGPFKETPNGNKYLLTATDYLTKYAEVKAVPNLSKEVTAQFILDDIICRHGAVEEILSDQGRNFMSDVVQQLMKLVGTRGVKTTTYEPQTNGLDEKFNGTLCKMISKYVDATHRDWDKYLSLLRLAYNTQVQSSTKVTPSMAIYGREIRLPVEVSAGEPVAVFDDITEHVADLRHNMPIIWDIVKSNIEIAQERQKEQYDKHHREVVYNPGDLVYVKSPARKKGLTDKFLYKNKGPYRVIGRYKENNYIVELVKGSRKREIHHVNKLSPCVTRDALFESSDDGDVESETEVYEVSDVRRNRNGSADKESETTEVYQVDESVTISNQDSRNLSQESRMDGYQSTPNRESTTSRSRRVTVNGTANKLPRRSSRTTKGIPPLRFSPTLTVILIAFYLFAFVFGDFHKVSPIIWRHTGKPVLVGVHPVEMAIKYFSPCNLLSDPTLLPFGSQAPLFNWCNTSFYADFIKPVGRMCPRVQTKSGSVGVKREKRVVMLLGLGAIAIGAAASIGLSSVAIAKTSRLEDRFDDFESTNRVLMENLKQVLENDNVEKMALKRLKGEISQMSDYVNKISADLGQLQKTLPTALIIMSKLGAQFSLTRNLLYEIGRKWKENELDPQLLQIFNVSLPCDGSCPLKYAKPKSCEWDENEGIIVIKFDLRVTQPKAHVLAADPFMLIEVNYTSANWCLKEYNGPNTVVYDETIDCLVPTKSTTLDFANDLILKPDETYCNKRQVTASDKYWEKKRCETLSTILEDDTVQVKNAGDQNFVFCHPFKIKLYEKLSPVECPNYVFALQSNRSFKVGRFSYTASQTYLKNQMVFAEDLSQRINFQILPRSGTLNLTDDFRLLDSIINSIDTDSPKFIFSDLHLSIIAVIIVAIVAVSVGIYVRIIRKAVVTASRRSRRVASQEEMQLMAGIDRKEEVKGNHPGVDDVNSIETEIQTNDENKIKDAKAPEANGKDTKVKLPFPKH